MFIGWGEGSGRWGRRGATRLAGAFLEFTAGGGVEPGDGFAVCKGYGSGQVEVVKSFANYV